MKKILPLVLIILVFGCKKKQQDPGFQSQTVTRTLKLYFTGLSSGNAYTVEYRKYPPESNNWNIVTPVPSGWSTTISVDGATCEQGGVNIGCWYFGVSHINTSDTTQIKAYIILGTDTIVRKTQNGTVTAFQTNGCY